MRKAQVHLAYSFQEAENFDRRFWKRAGAAMRFVAAWSCVKDYFKMRGHHGRLPRLRRTVQSIKFR